MWAGDSFELLILAGESDELLAETLRAAWSASLLEGPYQRSDVDPHEQTRLLPHRLPINEKLYGVLEMLDGVRAGVFTYTIGVSDEQTEWSVGRWLGIALPSGSLARAYRIETQALEAVPQTDWQDPVTERLRALADAIYAHARFRGAVIGWGAFFAELESALREGVPATRGVGYLLSDGDALRWHPPSPRTPEQPRPKIGPIQEFAGSGLGGCTMLSAFLLVFVLGAVTTTAPAVGTLLAAVLGVIPAILLAWVYLAFSLTAWSEVASGDVALVIDRAAAATTAVGAALGAISLILRLGLSIGMLPDTGWYGSAIYLAGYSVAIAGLMGLALHHQQPNERRG